MRDVLSWQIDRSVHCVTSSIQRDCIVCLLKTSSLCDVFKQHDMKIHWWVAHCATSSIVCVYCRKCSIFFFLLFSSRWIDFQNLVYRVTFSKYYLNVRRISKNQDNELNNSHFKIEYLKISLEYNRHKIVFSCSCDRSSKYAMTSTESSSASHLLFETQKNQFVHSIFFNKFISFFWKE